MYRPMTNLRMNALLVRVRVYMIAHVTHLTFFFFFFKEKLFFASQMCETHFCMMKHQTYCFQDNI